METSITVLKASGSTITELFPFRYEFLLIHTTQKEVTTVLLRLDITLNKTILIFYKINLRFRKMTTFAMVSFDLLYHLLEHKDKLVLDSNLNKQKISSFD